MKNADSLVSCLISSMMQASEQNAWFEQGLL